MLNFRKTRHSVEVFFKKRNIVESVVNFNLSSFPHIFPSGQVYQKSTISLSLSFSLSLSIYIS